MKKKSKKRDANYIENLSILLVCIACGVVLILSFIKEAEFNDGAIVFVLEEYDQIGYEYYSTGELSLMGVPSVFRAPGYPVFVALGLHARDYTESFLSILGVKSADSALEDGKWVLTADWVLEDGNWILLLQLLMLLVGGFVFYKTVRWWLPTIPAALFLAAYLVNPLTHTAVRSLSYGLLDFVMITILIFICFYLLRVEEISLRLVIVSGLFMALAALVRPIFLTFPVLIFALLFFLKDFSFREAATKAGLCLVFMATFISPYIFRNLSVAGSLIPISNQGTWAFWGNSVTPLYSEGSFAEIYSRQSETDSTASKGRLPWQKLWLAFGVEEFKKAIGERYSLGVLYQNSQTLSKHFGQEFLKNLSLNPNIYVQNIAGNVFYYVFGPRRYEEFHFWKMYTNKPEDMTDVFSSFNVVATSIILPILGYAAYRRNVSARMGLLLIGYFAFNYSLVFLDSRYLYTLMPVMWLCFAIAPESIRDILGDKFTWADHQGIALAAGTTTLFCQALPVFLTIGFERFG